MSVTVSQLLTQAEVKCQIASGAINNTTIGIPLLNEAMFDFRTSLIQNGVDAAPIQEAYIATVTPPTVGGSTFSYPSDMYFLKTIAVNMTNTQALGYIQAQQVDVSNTPNQVAFDYLRSQQPSSQPLFDDRGSYYEIFPSFTSAMNLTNAIKVIYFQQPTPYVTTADALSYPDTLDWYILALRVASLFFQSLNKFDEANFWDVKYQERLRKLIDTLDRGSQQPLQATPIQLTGWEF